MDSPGGTTVALARACLILLLAGSAAAEAPRARIVTPPAPFTRTLETPRFVIASDTALDLAEFGAAAETALDRAGERLGVAAERRSGAAIYVCSDERDVARIERLHGVRGPRARTTGRFQGRCHAEHGLILVPLRDRDELRWQIAHEVVHLAFHAAVGRNVEVLNEGLAEVLPHWILHAPGSDPADLDAPYPLYAARLERVVLQREVPTLEELCRLGSAAFYDTRAGWLHYALAWQLAKLLLEDDHPAVAGRLSPLIGALREKPLWPALCSVYDAATLESLWRERLHALARWQPVFGTWDGDGGALTGHAAPSASAFALAAWEPVAGTPWRASFALGAPLPHGAAVGFVLGYQHEDAFTFLELRPDDGHAVLLRRAGGRWVERECAELDLPSTHLSSIALDVGADGSMALATPGGEPVALEWRAPATGRAGLLIESRAGAPAGARATFVDARIEPRAPTCVAASLRRPR